MFRPHWVCPVQGCLCFPRQTAQAPGCSIWSGPCVECGSSFRVLHKSADSVAPACCVFPPASVVHAAKGLRACSQVRRAFSLRGERPGQPEAWAPSPWARRAFSLCGERPGQPEAWAHFPLMQCAFSLCGPSARCRVKSQEVFRQEPGPICRVGGGGFSGAEFAPFPSPLPPTSSGDGAALLCCFSVPLFCEPPAVCSGRLIFPCSPTV